MKYTNSSRIKRTEAVEIIAERLRRPDETKRQAKDRINHRINYAIKQGKLIQLQDGCFSFNDLAIWARSNWSNFFNDWTIVVAAECNMPLAFRGTANALVLPGSLERCHEAIWNMYETITTLEEKLAAANHQIEQLLPDANSWRKLILKNKSNAKKSRK